MLSNVQIDYQEKIDSETMEKKSPVLKDSESPLSFSDRFALFLQRMVSISLYPFSGPFAYLYVKYIRRIKYRRLSNVRETLLNATQGKNIPTLICANHLTMFDSIYLHCGLASFWSNLFHPKIFSWNVAAVEIFKSTLYRRVLTYMGKTLTVDRKGDSEHHQKMLDKYSYIMRKGDFCTIFPEGGRSRTGCVDLENVTYGAGKLLQSLSHYQVICVYMRGQNQKAHTVEPEKGDELYLDAEIILPKSTKPGMRGAREISLQIINKLKELEDRCFSQEDFSPPCIKPN